MEALSYCQLMERCLAAEARVVELAAENVAMREIIDAVRGVADKSGGIAGWHLNGDIAKWSEILPEIDNIETPVTDRIVAGIKADGVALAKSAFEKHIRSPSCYQDEVIGMESALSIVSQVELQLRESAK